MKIQLPSKPKSVYISLVMVFLLALVIVILVIDAELRGVRP